MNKSFLKNNTRISHSTKKVTHTMAIVAPERKIILSEIGWISHRANTVRVAPVRIITADNIPIKIFINTYC
ncbi:hypothetical protein KL86DYS1_31193 [uncultured Dysgonomonas sp.]|uniref:Uncharacterized protein n=1 Tax=uncultured Dysgonomonas sp. TaxID=206096 RepID=A0A212K264_9BACT|nr:hypothetical protein KL86DYS1_31193 [uncultured Dysgonomonas sp.]